MSMLKDGDKISSVRVTMLMCVAVASFIAIYCVMNDRDLIGATSLTGMFLGAGIGGKVVQKGKE